jgi:hypothetical protein
VRKPGRQRLFGRHCRRWKCNNKENFEEMYLECKLDLSEDREMWQGYFETINPIQQKLNTNYV